MVNVKKGDFVRMDFTGWVAPTGAIFETTDESLAKRAGIHDPSQVYGPKLAIFGSGMIMRGIEAAIQSVAPGKGEEFTFQPEQAFGKREKSLVRMMPEKEFSKQGMQPIVGMVISLDKMLATVKSVTSGRVVVDFNHPLAGERISYWVKVHEVITEPKKKVEAMLSSIAIKGTVEEKQGKLAVALDKTLPKEKADAAKAAILAVVPGTTFTGA